MFSVFGEYITNDYTKLPFKGQIKIYDKDLRNVKKDNSKEENFNLGSQPVGKELRASFWRWWR